ncbi:hypothetical protein [Sphingomonas dokdonensis]|nr:hypothetical protein [Sphingomonas dokdonensis]
MDFMKWLNSLGELLYEVMSWLVSYPITLWRVITNPLAMMTYADSELRDTQDEQFSDTLNPPLFLVLSLLLTRAADEAIGGGTNPIVAKQTGLASLITDDTSFLVLRLLLFSMFPLMMATRFLRAQRVPVTRQRLKAPFYGQCYACAPFALFLGLATSLGHAAIPGGHTIGPVLATVALLGYLSAVTMWFAHHLKQSLWRGLLNAGRAFVQAAVASFVIAALFVLR